MRGWSLDAALAGLPVALIAAGPVVVVAVAGRALPVYACQVAVAVLVVHIGFSVLARHSYGAPGILRWLLGAAALLALPVAWSVDIGAGLLAYVNFAAGTVGGLAIAVIWQNVRGWSWIDVGYCVFLVAGVAQLLYAYSSARTVSALHQSSLTPWGNSNFVAGCLVVAALVVMARRGRFTVLLGVAAIGVALLTLSRGALVAACVGLVVLLWSKPRLRRTATGQVDVNHLAVQLFARGLAVAAPIAAYLAVEHVTALRGQVNRQVHTNVDTRLDMYRLAWAEFLENPLTGTGWASFRAASLDTTGLSQTFAHNVLLSMLQIGGLLAVPYLVVLAVLLWRALRRGGRYAAPVAAAVAIAMTDPFFESTAGNLIVLPVAVLAALPGRDSGANPRVRRRTHIHMAGVPRDLTRSTSR